MVVREWDHIWLIVAFRGAFREADLLDRKREAIEVEGLLSLGVVLEADHSDSVL